jgi:hypothetical protein
MLAPVCMIRSVFLTFPLAGLRLIPIARQLTGKVKNGNEAHCEGTAAAYLCPEMKARYRNEDNFTAAQAKAKARAVAHAAAPANH